jgi:hypothetical protein
VVIKVALTPIATCPSSRRNAQPKYVLAYEEGVRDSRWCGHVLYRECVRRVLMKRGTHVRHLHVR